MNYTTIFLGTALVVLIMYMLFQSYFDGKQSLVSQTKLINMSPIEAEKVSKPNASILSYGIWVHIGQWSSGEHILFKRDTELEVYFTSDAGLKIKVYDGDDAVEATTTTDATAATDETHSHIVVTNNFPIQKWVHIGIVVDNQIMDVYLDGKMVKSVKLKQNIAPTENSITYGTGSAIASNTHIAEHKRITYALDPKGMWDLYMEGNGMGGLTQAASEMNVNLSILKDGVESSKISLW